MRRARCAFLGLCLGLTPAAGWAASWEAAVRTGVPGLAYLRAWDTVWVQAGTLSYSASVLYRADLHRLEAAVESLYLRRDAGALSITVGRFPLTFGEARLVPYTWQRSLPTGALEGVTGAALALYAPTHRLRLGYVVDHGPFAELSLRELKAYAFAGGGGVSASLPTGELVVYGDLFLVHGDLRLAAGVSGYWGAALYTVELVHPWAVGAALTWPLDGQSLSVAWLVRQGQSAVTLEWGTDRLVWELGVADSRVFVGLRVYPGGPSR